jgi:Ca2+/Na+ antiporter
MKTNQLGLFWVFLWISVALTSLFLEHLNAIKEGNNIDVYGIIFFYVYLIYALFFVLIFTKKTEKHYKDIILFLLYFIFSIVLGFSAFTQIFEKNIFHIQDHCIYGLFSFLFTYYYEYLSEEDEDDYYYEYLPEDTEGDDYYKHFSEDDEDDYYYYKYLPENNED